MRKVILLVLSVPVLAYGQIIETFESGDLDNWIQSTKGCWKADSSGSITGNYSLHHVFDNPVSGSDCIGIPLTDLHPQEGITRWTFSLRHGYDPSASNNWALYLMIDNNPVSFADGSTSSGFALGVNLNGYDDTLRLYKIRNGILSVVVTCPVNWQSDIGINESVLLIIERSASGYWNVTVLNNNNIRIGFAESTDKELFNYSWLILNYRYTSTRDRLLWLDDLKIEGMFHEDKDPPEILTCIASGIHSAELTLNEVPSEGIVEPGNFSLNIIGNTATSVIKTGVTTYRIGFETILNNKEVNNLLINRLCDISGNCYANLTIEFTPVWAEAGDIVITEIMADPLPEVTLPPEEYLEIFNRTDFTYNLKDWKLASNDQQTLFPSTEINPGEYVVLCSISDTSLFSSYGRTVGLKSFPSLTDDGRIIILYDSLDNMINGVEYSSAWYGNNLKNVGGWSLEIIDTGFPFYSEGNWEASSSRKGGTPGSVNSSSRSNPDKEFSGIRNVFPEDSFRIIMESTEPMFNLTGHIDEITISENLITGAAQSDPLFRRFTVTAEKPLERGKVYTLSVSAGITDFAGNPCICRSFLFGVPDPPVKEDVVFNELLFNPLPDDPDYLELFNLSEKVIDASELYLASVNDGTGETSEARQVSGERRCITPGSLYTVTTDRKKVISRFPASVPENIFHTSSLPSMPDDKGHLLLLNRQLDKIDEVLYSARMHYSLLSSCEGISLEKIRPDLPSDESSNWHSASESSGWGTPGDRNSVFSGELSGTDQVIFSSSKISPDNDGFEDALVINLNGKSQGNTVTVTIFDETGSYIRRIAENYLAGSRASLVWDATADDGTLVNTGIYIVLTELFNDRGKTKSWKKVCAVIR